MCIPQLRFSAFALSLSSLFRIAEFGVYTKYPETSLTANRAVMSWRVVYEEKQDNQSYSHRCRKLCKWTPGSTNRRARKDETVLQMQSNPVLIQNCTKSNENV